METTPGKNKEGVLTKTEILEILGRYAGSHTFEREKSDEHGICLYEIRYTNSETGEIAEYSYIRKGRLISIQVAYYDGKSEIPISGDMVAELDTKTGSWKDAKGYVKK